ncbi:MAG TPA: phosphotransferase, partial [Bacillales bacterium]|nr:phosphotransferase [Bacillales bacterium]
MAHQQTIKVRKGEEFNLRKLETYLRENLNHVPDGSLQVEQFPSGLSNLTYVLRIGDWEAVLRRPPLGPVAPKAHDMGRESKILNKVHPVFPLAPKPFVFCENPDIVGSSFFVMERRNGIVIDTEIPADLGLTEDDL